MYIWIMEKVGNNNSLLINKFNKKLTINFLWFCSTSDTSCILIFPQTMTCWLVASCKSVNSVNLSRLVSSRHCSTSWWVRVKKAPTDHELASFLALSSAQSRHVCKVWSSRCSNTICSTSGSSSEGVPWSQSGVFSHAIVSDTRRRNVFANSSPLASD